MDRLTRRQRRAAWLSGIGMLLLALGYWLTSELRQDHLAKPAHQNQDEDNAASTPAGLALVVVGGIFLGAGLYHWHRDPPGRDGSRWTNRNEDV